MIYHYEQTEVFYEVHGQGPTLVLLHGFLESSTMWKVVIPELMSSRKIIVIDLLGHGKTGCISSIHSMELMAKVVFDLLSAIGVKKHALIGHSMGGYVALAYAELFPKLLTSLTLLNSTTRRDNDDRKANRDRALLFMEKEKHTIISMAISNLFSEKNRIRFASEIELLKTEALSFPSEGITAAIKGMRDRIDRTEILKNFTKEKLLIVGENDPIVPFHVSEEIAKHTQTPIITLAGGHMSWLENKIEIVKIMHLIE